MRTRAVTIALIVAAIPAVAATTGSSAATVGVRLKEFSLAPSSKAVAAGRITFVVKNVGKINHEMVIIRTNVPPGKLPVNVNHRVPEKGVAGEVGDVHPGQTKRATIALKPGRYVLLCNLAGHYKAGQYSGFVVK